MWSPNPNGKNLFSRLDKIMSFDNSSSWKLGSQTSASNDFTFANISVLSLRPFNLIKPIPPQDKDHLTKSAFQSQFGADGFNPRQASPKVCKRGIGYAIQNALAAYADERPFFALPPVKGQWRVAHFFSAYAPSRKALLCVSLFNFEAMPPSSRG
jgi:hypothetical protein